VAHAGHHEIGRSDAAIPLALIARFLPRLGATSLHGCPFLLFAPTPGRASLTPQLGRQYSLEGKMHLREFFRADLAIGEHLLEHLAQVRDGRQVLR
jgi:hypothetical protein